MNYFFNYLCLSSSTSGLNQSGDSVLNMAQMATRTLSQIASQVRKSINAYKGQVRVVGNSIVIDNLGWNSAAGICSSVTGLEFIHISTSMTTLK